MNASSTALETASESGPGVTSDVETIKSLGINPASASGYSNVSREPVSFSHVENFGWGDVYQALHAATWDLWKGSERADIEVDGLSVTVAHGDAEEFEDLLQKWRLALDDASTRDH